jgi:hypothetical protein
VTRRSELTLSVMLVLCVSAPCDAAQSTGNSQPIVIGERFELHSQSTGETRSYFVHRPPDPAPILAGEAATPPVGCEPEGVIHARGHTGRSGTRSQSTCSGNANASSRTRPWRWPSPDRCWGRAPDQKDQVPRTSNGHCRRIVHSSRAAAFVAAAQQK